MAAREPAIGLRCHATRRPIQQTSAAFRRRWSRRPEDPDKQPPPPPIRRFPAAGRARARRAPGAPCFRTREVGASCPDGAIPRLQDTRPGAEAGPASADTRHCETFPGKTRGSRHSASLTDIHDVQLGPSSCDWLRQPSVTMRAVHLATRDFTRGSVPAAAAEPRATGLPRRKSSLGLSDPTGRYCLGIGMGGGWSKPVASPAVQGGKDGACGGWDRPRSRSPVPWASASRRSWVGPPVRIPMPLLAGSGAGGSAIATLSLGGAPPWRTPQVYC